MGDEHRTKPLEETLLSDVTLPLTDEMVDAYLSEARSYPRETVERMLKQYAIRAFEKLHPKSVRHIEESITFGRWIEEKRMDALLTRADLASVLGKRTSYVERLETGKILPWTVSVIDLADLLFLFRVHIDAVPELMERSLAVSMEYERAKREKASIRIARPEVKDPGIRKALDEHLARTLPKEELSGEVTACLQALRHEFEARRVLFLLK
jgi:transcriptional regulator with XRE-family HTH domain